MEDTLLRDEKVDREMIPMRVAILTVSDRCSRGAAEDRSGPALRVYLTNQFAANVVAAAIVADEALEIENRLANWCEGGDAMDLILTTGGTGLGPRDVTPEATNRVLERPHPGIMELIRAKCGATFPKAYLARGVAGVRGRTLIVNLPGSTAGAVESLAAIEPILPHAIEMLRGGDHPRE